MTIGCHYSRQIIRGFFRQLHIHTPRCCGQHVHVILIQFEALAQIGGGNVGVAGTHQQSNASTTQFLQCHLDLGIRQIGDHKHSRQLTGNGEIHQTATVLGVSGLIVGGGHVHAVVLEQTSIANKYAATIHPTGQTHPLLIHQTIDFVEQFLFILDDAAEDHGQGTTRTHRQRGSGQNRLVNMGTGERLDAVKQHTLVGVQIGDIHRQCIGLTEATHRLPSVEETASGQHTATASRQRILHRQQRDRHGETDHTGQDG